MGLYDLVGHPKRASLVGGTLPLASGGTASDLSATGPGFVRQATLGAVLTVSTIVAADMPTGIAAVNIGAGGVSNTEFGYLDGVTSGLQTQLDDKADLVGFNDWRCLPTRDPFEIRSNYGLTVTRNGDVYVIDWLTADAGIPTVAGGQGITVVVSGSNYTIHHREARVVVTDAATVTLDCTNDNNFRVNMSASPTNRTLAVSNVSVGQKFTVLLKNTGANTVTWWSGITWPYGVPPTLTTTASNGELFGFECLSAGVYLGFIVGQEFTL